MADVKIVIKAVDQASGEIKNVNKALGDLGKGKTGGASNAIEELRAQFAEAKKSSIDLGDAVETKVNQPLVSTEALAGFAGAAILALGTAIVAADKQFVDYGTSVFDLSNKYEISAESASKLIQVSDRLGISQKELEKALSDVRKHTIPSPVRFASARL